MSNVSDTLIQYRSRLHLHEEEQEQEQEQESQLVGIQF